MAEETAEDRARRGTNKDTSRLIADLATGIWRIRRRLHQDAQERHELQGVGRHVEASWDSLEQHGIEVKDDVGQKYVAGMAAQVLAFQTSDNVEHDTIIETVRPSVFYKDKLIQRGEVIVATPKAADAEGPRQAVEDDGHTSPKLAVSSHSNAVATSMPPNDQEVNDNAPTPTTNKD